MPEADRRNALPMKYNSAVAVEPNSNPMLNLLCAYTTHNPIPNPDKLNIRSGLNRVTKGRSLSISCIFARTFALDTLVRPIGTMEKHGSAEVKTSTTSSGW
jgi:hypothetical protein